MRTPLASRRVRSAALALSTCVGSALLVAACGGKIEPSGSRSDEPTGDGTQQQGTTSSAPSPSSSPGDDGAKRTPTDGRPTKWMAETACAGVRTAIDGPSGSGPRTVQNLTRPEDLQRVLQGFWYACNGSTGFEDKTFMGKPVVGFLVEGDRVTTVLPSGSANFVRGGEVGWLDATGGSSFVLNGETFWVVFSKTGLAGLFGRSSTGSTELEIARLPWQD